MSALFSALGSLHAVTRAHHRSVRTAVPCLFSHLFFVFMCFASLISVAVPVAAFSVSALVPASIVGTVLPNSHWPQSFFVPTRSMMSIAIGRFLALPEYRMQPNASMVHSMNAISSPVDPTTGHNAGGFMPGPSTTWAAVLAPSVTPSAHESLNASTHTVSGVKGTTKLRVYDVASFRKLNMSAMSDSDLGTVIIALAVGLDDLKDGVGLSAAAAAKSSQSGHIQTALAPRMNVTSSVLPKKAVLSWKLNATDIVNDEFLRWCRFNAKRAVVALKMMDSECHIITKHVAQALKVVNRMIDTVQTIVMCCSLLASVMLPVVVVFVTEELSQAVGQLDAMCAHDSNGPAEKQTSQASIGQGCQRCHHPAETELATRELISRGVGETATKIIVPCGASRADSSTMVCDLDNAALGQVKAARGAARRACVVAGMGLVIARASAHRRVAAREQARRSEALLVEAQHSERVALDAAEKAKVQAANAWAVAKEAQSNEKAALKAVAATEASEARANEQIKIEKNKVLEAIKTAKSAQAREATAWRASAAVEAREKSAVEAAKVAQSSEKTALDVAERAKASEVQAVTAAKLAMQLVETSRATAESAVANEMAIRSQFEALTARQISAIDAKTYTDRIAALELRLDAFKKQAESAKAKAQENDALLAEARSVVKNSLLFCRPCGSATCSIIPHFHERLAFSCNRLATLIGYAASKGVDVSTLALVPRHPAQGFMQPIAGHHQYHLYHRTPVWPAPNLQGPIPYWPTPPQGPVSRFGN